MKTSLVSSVVDIASAALSKSAEVKAARVKADQPQQLKSVTVYWRGRKMVLMQRPQRRLSALLCKLLRRSWQNLFGTLVKTIGAGAMATAALAAHADIANNTLPTGYYLRDGTARMWQRHNHMTIKQSSENAMYDWQSFSIGSRAGVRFIMNDANATALNRVLGNDPSIIMGSLTSNGKIFLINAAGILVGKTGKIDVAGFTASTLNISDADFKAGKMNFAADPGKTIGDVQNIGMIKTKDGGSVYLIGANVENDGIISAPNGQVLLAAGSMVKLVDTSLPGVSIEVSGVDGKVTNLGQIIASAGTIGIGAALVDNSGLIKASSVEKEGGRIFLRAAVHLTTGDGSEIEANGTTGGNIQLYSDGITNIRGNVSALGSAGNGGYIDTSGKAGLSVHYVPKLGPGGEWIIDPYDIDIASGGNDLFVPILDDVIALVTGHTTVSDGTINAQLNSGVSITLATGPGPGPNGGRITLDSGAAIAKTGGGAATLTLNAATDIDLNGTISDGSTAANANGLSLALIAGSNVNAAGNITLGGNLTSHATAFTVSSGSTVNLYGSSNSFNNDFKMTGGTLNANGATVFQNASVGDNSTLNLNAATTVNNNMVVSNGTLNVNAATTMVNLTVNVSSISTVNLNANLTTSQLNLMNGVIKALNPSTFTVSHSFTQTNGSLDLKTANISQTTGDLQIGAGGIKADNLTLNATNGAITQTGNVSATSLNATASNAITLNSNDNSVTNFGASNTSGDIVLNTSGAVTLTGITASNGDVTITDTNNDINIIGAISTSGATHKVKLAAGAGGVGASGGILQQTTGAGITTHELTASAGIDVDLGDNTNNNENHIATFTGKSDTGHVYLGNTGNLATFSNISAANEVKLYTEGSLTVGGAGIAAPLINLYTASPNPDVPVNTDIAINGLLTGAVVNGLPTAATAVNLRSGTGQITQTAGIITASLNAMAATGIALNNSSNAIGTLLASNSISGNVNVTNGSDQLLTLGAINNSNGTIAIDTQGDMTVSDTVSSSSGAINLTSQGNLTVDSAISSTNGVVTLSSVDGLTIGGLGSVSGHDINLTTTSGTDGDINIWGSLQATGEQRNEGAAGNITMSSARGVYEFVDNDNYYYGSIIGQNLNISAVGDIGLRPEGGVYNSVSTFIANSTNGSVELTNNGDLTLAGITATHGAVNIDTSGNMTVNSAGNNSAAITSGSGINLWTYAPVQEEAFNEGGNGGDLPPTVHADMTINGNLTSSSGVGINLDSAGAIKQAAGKISNRNADGFFDVSLIARGGDLEVGGDGIAARNISLRTYAVAGSKGDDDQVVPPFNPNILIKSLMTASSAVSLNSAGSISQDADASFGITAASLDARSFAGTTLSSTGNNISAFTANNARQGDILSTGDIKLTNASTVLTLAGNINNDALNGNVSITNTGVNNVGGDIIGHATFDHEHNTSTGTTTNGKVTYTSTNGNVTLSGVTATDLDVNAHDAVSLDHDSVLTVNGTMNVSSGTGITISNSGGCGTTYIANFAANNTGSGDITLASGNIQRGIGGDVNLLAISNAGRGISITNNNGSIQTTGAISGANIVLATNSGNSDHPVNITINSLLNGTDSVTLNGGDVGSITEGANGGISTALLTATATSGITLDSAHNTANGFAATNAHSSQAAADGDIKFVNNSNVTTSHTLTTHVVHTEHGNISIENTGAMVTTDLIDAPAGTVTLRTHSPLTIGAGGVSASGNVSLTAGNPGSSSSSSDNLVINGAVASGGNLNMAAGNNFTVNAAVTSAGSVSVSAGGGIIINDPLPPGTQFFNTPGPIDPAPPPSAVTPVVPPTTSNTVDQNVANTSNNANNNGDTGVVLPTTTTNTTQQTANSSTNQTVGGSDGEFGGGDTSKDDKKDTSGKSGKPLPICS
jgi:filamentous hemagglutinin family protein